MAGEHDAIVVYGTTWCPDCKRAKQFLGEQRIHFHWVDIERDRNGFVLTDQALETSMKGVFAAGDIRKDATNQLASAAGEGTTAALMIRDYLRTAR